MRGIGFELKKLICSKLFAAGTVIAFGLFAYMLISACLESAVTESARKYAEYTATLPNPITEEFIATLKEKNAAELEEYNSHIGEENSDYVEPEFFDAECTFLQQYEYSGRYAEDMTAYVKENLLLKGMTDSESEKAMYQKVADIYNRSVNISLINSLPVEYYYMQLHFSGSWAAVLFGPIMIVWAAILTAYLLCCERVSGTEGTVYSSPKGRTKLYFGKLAAVTVTVLAAVIVMLAADVICAAAVFRVDLFASVQSLPMFEYCQHKLTILGLYLMTYFMLFCSMMTGVFIVSLISVRAAYPIRGMVAGFILGIGSWQMIAAVRQIVQTSPSLSYVAHTARTFFPPYLTCPIDYLTSFDHLSMFGIPVARVFIAMAVTLLTGAAAISVSAKFYGKSSEIRWKAKLFSLIKPNHSPGA